MSDALMDEVAAFFEANPNASAIRLAEHLGCPTRVASKLRKRYRAHMGLKGTWGTSQKGAELRARWEQLDSDDRESALQIVRDAQRILGEELAQIADEVEESRGHAELPHGLTRVMVDIARVAQLTVDTFPGLMAVAKGDDDGPTQKVSFDFERILDAVRQNEEAEGGD